MIPFDCTDVDLDEVQVQLKPRLQCTWRWSSSSQLTCTLSNYLKYATTYSVEIDSSFEAIDGTQLSEVVSYTFSIASLGATADIDYWDDPTEPIAKLSFSQPVALSTVLEKVRFRDSSTNDRVSVKPRSTQKVRFRDKVFFQQKQVGHWIRISKADTEQLISVLRTQGAGDTSRDVDPRTIASRHWVVEPTESLLLGTSYDLDVLPGVTSVFGTEPTRQVLHASWFTTFSSFELVGLECTYTTGATHQQILGEPGHVELTGCDPDGEQRCCLQLH